MNLQKRALRKHYIVMRLIDYLNAIAKARQTYSSTMETSGCMCCRYVNYKLGSLPSKASYFVFGESHTDHALHETPRARSHVIPAQSPLSIMRCFRRDLKLPDQ